MADFTVDLDINTIAQRDLVITIQQALSELIRRQMLAVSNEQDMPGHNPDIADEKIARGKTKIGQLRDMRDAFEELTTNLV